MGVTPLPGDARLVPVSPAFPKKKAARTPIRATVLLNPERPLYTS
jgi:hypothetical protein